MDFTILWTVLTGIGIGLFSAVIGYIKAIPDGEDWDWVKAIPVLVLGMIAGVLWKLQGFDIGYWLNYLEATGFVLVINNVWKAIWKFIQNKISEGQLVVKKRPI